MEALARIINCNEELLHDKDIWSRVHLPLGPGLGFLNLMEAAEPAYCAAWLQAVFRLSRCNDSPFKLPALPDPSGAYQVLAAKAMANKCLLENDPFLHLQHFFSGKGLLWHSTNSHRVTGKNSENYCRVLQR